MTGVGSVFMFHSRCFLEKTRLSPATTDTHCPLPTPPPGGCFAELIYPGCLAPPGRRKTGDRGAGVERPGLCRGRPAGARWQEHGKAPRSTPGPRAGRPRAGRGVGAREAAVCSLHCPPRPGATTAPSANVSVERRSHPHPPGKIREGRAAPQPRGVGAALLPIGASLITTSSQTSYLPVHRARRKVPVLPPEPSRVRKQKKRRRC